MKTLIPFVCILFFLQSCAVKNSPTNDAVNSQNQSTKVEENAVTEEEEILEKKKKTEEIKTVTTNPNNASSGAVQEDVPTTTKTTTTTKGKAESKKKDKKIVQELSVITFDHIEEVSVEDEKADMPVEGQKVKLLIQNNHDYAMWYLMPTSGESVLVKDGKFKPSDIVDQPFLGKLYSKAGEQLVELVFMGQTQQSFRAFRIKAKSSMLFRNYNMGNYQQGTVVPFWAVKTLKVNNQYLLEEWLPFGVLCTPNIELQNKRGSDWLNLSENAKFKPTKINHIQASGITKYKIPVGLVK